jgi:hypothetical protein
MHRKGLSASRIGCAHLVISAVLAEAVRDKKLAGSPCTGMLPPGTCSRRRLGSTLLMPRYPHLSVGADKYSTGKPPRCYVRGDGSARPPAPSYRPARAAGGIEVKRSPGRRAV